MMNFQNSLRAFLVSLFLLGGQAAWAQAVCPLSDGVVRNSAPAMHTFEYALYQGQLVDLVKIGNAAYNGFAACRILPDGTVRPSWDNADMFTAAMLSGLQRKTMGERLLQWETFADIIKVGIKLPGFDGRVVVSAERAASVPTVAELQALVQEVMPTAPKELTEDMAQQVRGLIEEAFRQEGEEFPERLKELLRGYAYATTADVDALSERIVREMTNRINALEERIAAAEAAAASNAAAITNKADLGFVTTELGKKADVADLTIGGYDYRQIGLGVAGLLALLGLATFFLNRSFTKKRVRGVEDTLRQKIAEVKAEAITAVKAAMIDELAQPTSDAAQALRKVEALHEQVTTAEAIATAASTLAGRTRDVVREMQACLDMKEITLPENLTYDLTMLAVDRQLDFEMKIDGVVYLIRVLKTKIGYVKALDGCIANQHNEMKIDAIESTLRRHAGKDRIVGVAAAQVIMLPAPKQ